MSHILDEEYGKVFPYVFEGRRRWFVFRGGEFRIVYKEGGKLVNRPASAYDWMGIGGDTSEGFVECDFRGCNFRNYDIAGTCFIRCIFDYDAFDYSFVKYDGMIDCKFTGKNNDYKTD